MLHCGFHYKGCKMMALPATMLNTSSLFDSPSSVCRLQILRFGARRGPKCTSIRLLSQQTVLKCNWREISILTDHHRPSVTQWTCLQVDATATRVLEDMVATKFESICLNPKALSTETVEFMLEVQASNHTLSKDESEDASRVDVKGVHPGTFKSVLIVCVTTLFPLSVTIEDVETARKRAQHWEKAVGQDFLVMALVAGFEIEHWLCSLLKSIE